MWAAVIALASTVMPIVGEALGPLQLTGGALVLAAVVLPPPQLRRGRGTMRRWHTSSRPAGWLTRAARSGSPS